MHTTWLGFLRRTTISKVILVILVFAAIGSLLIAATRAATQAVHSEAENGVLSHNDLTVTDSAASGGQAIRFSEAAPTSPTCNLNATTTTFTSQVAAATDGQTICLASGSYGTWSGVNKRIVITKQAGASPSMALNVANIANLTIDGIAITKADLNRNIKNLTIKNSTFTGFVYIDATGMLAGNIMFDNNIHSNIFLPEPVTGSTGREGRIHIGNGFLGTGSVTQNSGIIVRNSLFSGGTADGIRVDDGVAGVSILNNEFTQNTDQNREEVHSDPIQFYGSNTITVKNNYFHTPSGVASCSLGQHDGGSGHTIVNNLIVGGNGCYFGMYLRADRNSTVSHNTFAYGNCGGQNCGILWVGGKPGSSGGGTIYEDNIFTSFNQSDVAVSITARNNLTRSSIGGPSNITGAPTYMAGTGIDAYKLAAGSLGKNQAANTAVGPDIGVNTATVGRNRGTQ